MVGSSGAGPLGFPLFLEPTPAAVDLFATATSLRLTHFLRRRITHHIRFAFNLHSFDKKLAPVIEFSSKVKNAWCSSALHFPGLNFLEVILSSTHAACLYFFGGGETGSSLKNERISHWKTSNRNPQNDQRWTNILLAVNILAYLAQVASEGKLLLWGAKINGLIDQGQLWRLVTSSFLHANIGHLMVNCYSLNSVGPAVEKVSGTWRFLAVYFASAIASSSMSYWFCKAPSVGASGAIFGLVGSFAVFVARHRKLVGRGKEDLRHIAQIIILNMAIGIMSRGIDNWGHLGGFLGGAAISWLLGPAWKEEPSFENGQRTFTDRAPIFFLISGRKRT
ncbi:RHOMBOID-like protein 10, chloroplastic isoform X2 [Benincasa hispida]|uniref:RHOMBOID-like protein 10, chloroplastic isoform X2 n=1 Tax=Benincasa hispida TaxID=102211 RepID=UPI0019029F19|nr:RHOMBOID-like protein 10, chloroplastic isoform X2 [Benincasa hispida]